MRHSTGYRKVILFIAMAAACVALAVAGKISGDAALAAISTAFTAALGLNIMEHRKGVVPPALPRGALPPLPRASARPGFLGAEPTAESDPPPEVDPQALARAVAEVLARRR